MVPGDVPIKPTSLRLSGSLGELALSGVEKHSHPLFVPSVVKTASTPTKPVDAPVPADVYFEYPEVGVKALSATNSGSGDQIAFFRPCDAQTTTNSINIYSTEDSSFVDTVHFWSSFVPDSMQFAYTKSVSEGELPYYVFSLINGEEQKLQIVRAKNDSGNYIIDLLNIDLHDGFLVSTSQAYVFVYQGHPQLYQMNAQIIAINLITLSNATLNAFSDNGGRVSHLGTVDEILFVVKSGDRITVANAVSVRGHGGREQRGRWVH